MELVHCVGDNMYAVLAQSVEREAVNLEVAGSIPAYSVCENAEPRNEGRCSRIIRRWFTIVG